MNTRAKLKVIAVDLDGTLCTGVAWDEKSCLKAKPIEENIKEVNRLHKTNFIFIWTARRDNLIPATLEWLRRNNVSYMAISNKKASSDIYVDDRAIRPNELKNL